jgi:hypothetical protein
VRELENILERAVALSEASEIHPADLRLHPLIAPGEGAVASSVAGASGSPLPVYLDKVERDAILAALAKTGFNRTAAARLLGLTLRTLRYRMQRLGIRELRTGWSRTAEPAGAGWAWRSARRVPSPNSDSRPAASRFRLRWSIRSACRAGATVVMRSSGCSPTGSILGASLIR